MKITQSFIVARPIAAVWGFFQDVPSVAACLPGTELIEYAGVEGEVSIGRVLDQKDASTQPASGK